MTETRIHPETGKTLTRGTRTMIVRYGSMSREVDVHGWYPEDDSDAVHSGADLRAADEALAELRTAYAAHVREVRKSLGLSQEDAGEIIGGGRRAFHKYESGKQPPSDAAVGLIELLWNYPQGLDVLKSIRCGTQAAGTRQRACEPLAV